MNSSRLCCGAVTFLAAVVCFASLASLPATAQQPPTLPKRLVADYDMWSKYLDPPYTYSAAQIPYQKLTHIIHAGVPFNADGSLSIPDGYIEPELINMAHAAGVKVQMLIGGDFYGVENAGSIATLVDNVNAAVQQYGYDGVDVDWEYPETTTDRNFLVDLMARLRKSNSNYVLSIDAAPWGGYGYFVTELKKSLTFFNIMMYDCAGPWTAYGQLNSPIFWDHRDPAPWECQPGGSVEGAANIFLAKIPAEQLNMGTPFYGYHYTNIHREFGFCPNAATTQDEACDYAVTTQNYGPNIKPLINKDGWHTYYDPVAMVPYMTRGDGKEGYVTYDDPTSTYMRVWYSDWQRGLGGTFMWSLDADYDGHSQDLLDAMYSATMAGH